MKKKFIVFLALVAALSIPAYAVVITSTSYGTAAWPNGPCGTAPDVITAQLPPTSSNSNSAYVSENNFDGNSTWKATAGQTFHANRTGPLQGIAVTVSGTPAGADPCLYSLGLWDLGTSFDPNRGYVTASQFLPANELLGAGSVYWNYYGGGSEAVQLLDLRQFNVTLNYCHWYLFAIDEWANNKLTWYRTGNWYGKGGDVGQGYKMSSDGTGNLYQLNTAGRDFGTAIYIPEPVTIALLSLGGLALLRKRK